MLIYSLSKFKMLRFLPRLHTLIRLSLRVDLPSSLSLRSIWWCIVTSAQYDDECQSGVHSPSSSNNLVLSITEYFGQASSLSVRLNDLYPIKCTDYVIISDADNTPVHSVSGWDWVSRRREKTYDCCFFPRSNYFVLEEIDHRQVDNTSFSEVTLGWPTSDFQLMAWQLSCT